MPDEARQAARAQRTLDEYISGLRAEVERAGVFERNSNSFVEQELRAKAELYAERNLVYGDNYKLYGHAMQWLFPDDVVLKTAQDHNRFGVLTQVVSKLTRYCQNFARGGHDDSLDDLAVYAMMLKELDHEARYYAEKGECPPTRTQPSSAERRDAGWVAAAVHRELREEMKDASEEEREGSAAEVAQQTNAKLREALEEAQKRGCIRGWDERKQQVQDEESPENNSKSIDYYDRGYEAGKISEEVEGRRKLWQKITGRGADGAAPTLQAYIRGYEQAKEDFGIAPGARPRGEKH